ncbi:WXG100 family type VII secretion target [Nocardia rhizosphaerae]|uniref:WXG100 family type VII secretion target n=1 Tax=Nocardia rhizosphaerae TaxID=1691571 RepID=A0ABV8L4M2_9NOCA
MRSISGRAAGTDPDYAPVVEVFDHLSHAEIYQAVRELDPAALTGAGELFLTTSTALGGEVENAHGEIGAAIADGWRGGAAQRAVDAVREFEQAGRRIADVLTAVGVRLSRAGDAAESVRAAVAEPEGTQPDPDTALLYSEQAGANATIARQAENARLDAVQAMETIYAGVFVPTGSGVPAFPGIASGTGDVGAAAAPSFLGGGAAVPSGSAVTPDTDTTSRSGTADDDGTIDTDTTTPAGVQLASGNSAGATLSAATSMSTPTAATPIHGATPGGGHTGATAGVSPGGPGSTAPSGGALPGVGGPPRRNRPATDRVANGGTGIPVLTGENGGAGGGRSTPNDSAQVSARTNGGVADPANTDVAAAAAHSGGDGPSSTGTAGVQQLTHTVNSESTETAQANEGRQDVVAAGADATAGMSAGAIGGLLGGAMVAADHTRPPGGPRPPERQDDEDEDDEFLRYLDEEPTYLEPADEVNPLIGRMEPTSPAVLGEWTGRE